MSYRTALVAVVVLAVVAGAADATRVEGYCYLDGETDHSGTKVEIDGSAIHSAKYTEPSGYYGRWSSVLPGWHTFTYTHLGFLKETHEFQVPLIGVHELPPVTLERGLAGSLSGVLGPGDFSVEGDIWVESGDALDIVPNTRLLFEGHYKFDVYGLLKAVGDARHPTVFTRSAANPDLDWGGIRFHSADESCRLEHCRIEYGHANGPGDEACGGGVFCETTTLTMEYCSVTDNRADFEGGGICCHFSDLLLWKCLFSRNEATRGGGASYTYNSHNNPTCEFTSCTFYDNNADDCGGGVYFWDIWWPRGAEGKRLASDEYDRVVDDRFSHPSITNCIFWYNWTDQISTYRELDVNYCDIEGGWPDGVGNIDCDPLFDEDCCLTWLNYPVEDETKSCCIDAGPPPPKLPRDLDGTRADIGECPYFQVPVGGCEYLGRCVEDMYLERVWGDPPYESREFTIGVHDGASWSPPIWPPQNLVLFMMDMEGITFPRGRPALYYFGQIVAYDAATCDTVAVTRLSDYSRGNHGLAVQPEGSWVSYWYTVLGQDLLFHIDGSGNPIGSFPAGSDSITGLAFDSSNRHLWGIVRGDPDRFVEYDVSTGVPTLIQGPFPVPWSEAGATRAAAGLDYDRKSNRLIAVNTASRTLEYFSDSRPAYPGPPSLDEPRVCSEAVCDIFPSPPTPWGVSAIYDIDKVFIADNTPGGPFPLDEYLYEGWVGVEEEEIGSGPWSYYLSQNCPNPFNPVTRIKYQLPEVCHVTLEVYNLAGQKVATLVDGLQEAGTWAVPWDATGIASGVYFYRLSTDGATATRRMVILK